MSLEIIDARYNEVMADLYDAMAASGRFSDAATIVEDEARKWLKQFIRFLAPRNKAQGEGAIKADLNKIFTPVDTDFAQHIASVFGTSGLDQWLTDPQGQRYEIKWDRLDVQGYGMDAYHKSQRNARGRVPGRAIPTMVGKQWPAKYVVSVDAFKAFVEKLKRNVGMLKSGWLRAYYEIGGKLPSWIQRHAGKALGGVVNELSVPGKPSITMSNHAPGIGGYERLARETTRARTEAMAKRIRLLIGNYNKDIVRGIKIRKSEAATSDSFFFTE